MVNPASGTHVPFRLKTLLMLLAFGLTWKASEAAPLGTYPQRPAAPADPSKIAAKGPSSLAPPASGSQETQFTAFSPVPAGKSSTESRGIISPGGEPPGDTTTRELWTIQLLPSGLLYRSYLAGPREPRFGYEWLYDAHRRDWVNEVTLGGRAGLIRFGNHDPQSPEGWQLDVEGAAFPRLAAGSLDLVAADFRFGVPLTWRSGRFQAKAAYYHLSSHVGDEFLLSTTSNFSRINFSRNAFVLGTGYFPLEDLRLYGEIGYGVLNDGGNQPWEFQFGAERAPSRPTGSQGALFWAVNAHLRQEVDFGGSFTAEAGWAWRGADTGYLFRVGGQYFTGHTRQFEFLGRTEDFVGIGVWLDY